jgi:hypothetical protein
LETITIPGDTTGTWLTTNGVGAYLYLATGAGSTVSGTAGAWAGADYRSATGAVNLISTLGATFYITGVQLEAGSVASPFERRDYGRELIMCQRYYQVHANLMTTGYGASGTNIWTTVTLPVAMRASPSASLTGFANFNGGNAAVNDVNASMLRTSMTVTATGTAYSVVTTTALAIEL